jgi:hypothetical protein
MSPGRSMRRNVTDKAASRGMTIRFYRGRRGARAGLSHSRSPGDPPG